MSRRLIIPEAKDLARKCFVNHGVPDEISELVGDQLVASEIDGQSGHGLMRVGSYIRQIKARKIEPKAVAKLDAVTAVVGKSSAENGFSYPAIRLALDFITKSAREYGISLAGVVHSHHFGQVGLHVEKLALNGLIGICLGNTPKAMALHGGSKPFFGTNPIAFACPIKDSDPLVIDLALSVVARGKIVRAKQEGKKIPSDWAVDSNGQPTTDPAEALKGSLIAIGGAKGSALALMVEILSACLTNSNLSSKASSLLEPGGGYPNLGHTFIAINPNVFAENNSPDFENKISELFRDASDISPESRMPGTRRIKLRTAAQKDGIEISDILYEELMELLNE